MRLSGISDPFSIHLQCSRANVETTGHCFRVVDGIASYISSDNQAILKMEVGLKSMILYICLNYSIFSFIFNLCAISLCLASKLSHLFVKMGKNDVSPILRDLTLEDFIQSKTKVNYANLYVYFYHGI